MLLKQQFISIDDYFILEKNSNVKHEFVNGHIYSMAGANRKHNLININLSSSIYRHLKTSVCNVYSNDMKVKINTAQTQAVYYPDIVVSCDDQPESEYYETKPILIIEILSKSTRRIDESEKLEIYQKIPSLLEYVTIEPNQPHITHYGMINGFVETSILNNERILELSSIGLKIPFSDIYSGIDF